MKKKLRINEHWENAPLTVIVTGTIILEDKSEEPVTREEWYRYPEEVRNYRVCVVNRGSDFSKEHCLTKNGAEENLRLSHKYRPIRKWILKTKKKKNA